MLSSGEEKTEAADTEIRLSGLASFDIPLTWTKTGGQDAGTNEITKLQAEA